MMKSRYVWSGLLYAGGLLSMVLGLEDVSPGQSCTSVLYTPARCTHAHSTVPVQSGSHSYCQWQSNVCEKASPTSCVDRWGIAYAGDCVHDVIGTTVTYDCFQDAHLTLVNVWWYVAKCKQNNGDCECKWEPSSTTSPLQLCDCYDELYEGN